MSKVLVIHPDDRSTDFLKKVYENKDYDVINDLDKLSNPEYVRSQIQAHDKVMMMGHGTSHGLINPKYFSYHSGNCSPFIIDSRFSKLLQEKETVTIWCFSDKFCMTNNLTGFHTGMIISEVGEAHAMLGYSPLTASELLDNMNLFAESLNKCIDKTPEEMKQYMLENYIGEDDITNFNRNNIKVLTSDTIRASYTANNLYRWFNSFDEVHYD